MSDRTEPSVVYAAGEHRSHSEHAAEAYDLMRRAEAMYPNWTPGDIERTRALAQWHATMAVYEALVLPGYGMSVGEHADHVRERGS